MNHSESYIHSPWNPYIMRWMNDNVYIYIQYIHEVIIVKYGWSYNKRTMESAIGLVLNHNTYKSLFDLFIQADNSHINDTIIKLFHHIPSKKVEDHQQYLKAPN